MGSCCGSWKTVLNYRRVKARGVDAVKLLYRERPAEKTGRVSLWVVKRDAAVGKPLHELEKVEVWVTLHAGQEDLETCKQDGHAGLRRQKIVRLSEEILEQHGVATQEALARLLGTNVRTVQRDIAYLLKQDLRVITQRKRARLVTFSRQPGFLLASY